MQSTARYKYATLKRMIVLAMTKVLKASAIEFDPTLEFQTLEEFNEKVQRQVDMDKRGRDRYRCQVPRHYCDPPHKEGFERYKALLNESKTRTNVNKRLWRKLERERPGPLRKWLKPGEENY